MTDTQIVSALKTKRIQLAGEISARIKAVDFHLADEAVERAPAEFQSKM